MSKAPEGYDLSYDRPSVSEYLRLREDGGLSSYTREAAEKGLPGSLFAVTLRKDGRAIGMGRLIGDGGCFFQIVDIVVDSDHRGQGLGKVIMTALMDYIEETLPDTAYVSLLADVPANQLYTQYGFRETAPKTLGMSYRVRRNNEG